MLRPFSPWAMRADDHRPRARASIYTNPSRAARPKPEASGRERFWWYFMRMSGLALVFLALGHMFIMHVLVELTGGEINFAFVQSRWGTPFWRIYDLLLLVLAFIHGANGARIVIGDYVAHRTARGLLDRHPDRHQRHLAGARHGGDRLLRSGHRAARRPVLVTLATVGRGLIPPTRVHELDAVVVGAGGAGLYAALELKQDLGPEARIGVISKLYPSRSHTGAAQGGVCAALGNTEEDHWEWHWFDTVKGGDYLVDQDAAEVMCHDAVETIINLEHLGLPFDRTAEGLINQRRFGGHTRNYGEGPVRRSCFAADRTGHAILQTLFQQCIRHDVAFFDEYQVLDLALPEGPSGPVSGVIALQLAHQRAARLPGQGRPVRDRRLRQGLQGHQQRAHPDRRRDGDPVSARPAARGHGVLPVPPDRHVQAGLPPLGGDARRGRRARSTTRASASWSATRRP